MPSTSRTFITLGSTTRNVSLIVRTVKRIFVSPLANVRRVNLTMQLNPSRNWSAARYEKTCTHNDCGNRRPSSDFLDCSGPVGGQRLPTGPHRRPRCASWIRMIVPDSSVYTDSRAGYHTFDISPFYHAWINHSERFVDRENPKRIFVSPLANVRRVNLTMQLNPSRNWSAARYEKTCTHNDCGNRRPSSDFLDCSGPVVELDTTSHAKLPANSTGNGDGKHHSRRNER